MEKLTLPKTRDEAQSSGSKFFYTGEPCVNGHDEKRYTSSRACFLCNRESSKSKLRRTSIKDREKWILNNISYDKESGRLIGVNERTNRNGYRICSVLGKDMISHRVIFFISLGRWPKQVDHINHIRSDNRWVNIREVDGFENQKNRSKNKNNKSGATGVSWDKRRGKWLSRICVNRKLINIGWFSNIDDAIQARKKADIKYRFHENHGS